MAATLYAWACPAAFTASPVDHTWVTAFDNRAVEYDDIAAVAAAAAEYWFCWGVYHPRGESSSRPAGLLGIQAGDPAQARCVAVPNVSSNEEPAARGTIFLYGIHGVCHQIANQVLFTTRTTGQPLTVRRARAYWLSDFIWGTYGTNERAWRQRAGRCNLPGAKSAVGALLQTVVPDLFAERAGALLGGEPARLSRLFGLRSEVRVENALQPAPLAPSSAGAVNQRNWEIQKEAASILGEGRFREVFEEDPSQCLELVDPAIYEAQAAEREG